VVSNHNATQNSSVSPSQVPQATELATRLVTRVNSTGDDDDGDDVPVQATGNNTVASIASDTSGSIPAEPDRQKMLEHEVRH
jgi:hypothetical protein